MTKVEHTPGPWENAYMPSTGFGCGYGKSQIIAANGKAVAGVALVEPEVGPMYRDGSFSQEAFDTLEANARLIAAAPALLTACKAAQQIIHNLHCVQADLQHLHYPACSQLLRAIAQAEGA